MTQLNTILGQQTDTYFNSGLNVRLRISLYSGVAPCNVFPIKSIRYMGINEYGFGPFRVIRNCRIAEIIDWKMTRHDIGCGGELS